jgi:hypothetical protein
MAAVTGVALLAVLTLGVAATRVAAVVWLLWQRSEPEVPVLPVDLTRPGGDPADAGQAYFTRLRGQLAHRRRSRAL